MSEYVFRDKRRKQPKYVERLSQDELIDGAWRKKERYAKLAKEGKDRWNDMTPIERAVRAVRISEGMKKAAMIRQARIDNPPQICVGCASYESTLYVEALPKVVWLCKDCLHMYKRYG